MVVNHIGVDPHSDCAINIIICDETAPFLVSHLSGSAISRNIGAAFCPKKPRNFEQRSYPDTELLHMHSPLVDIYQPALRVICLNSVNTAQHLHTLDNQFAIVLTRKNRASRNW
jgi:hypothetical protein